MKARPIELLYPSLLATYPVLLLAAGNPGEFLWSDLALVLPLALAAGAAVHAAVRWVLRRRPSEVSAFVAAAINAWLFCATSFADRMSRLVLPRYSMLALLVASTALVAWRVKRRAPAPAASRGAAAFSIALVFGAIVSLVTVEARVRHTFDTSPSVATLRAPLAPRLAAGPRPDVYLVVLDNLANSQVLRTLYGVPRRPFEDSLRALGFTIPATRSNYCHTAQSLATLLNAGQVRVLERDLGSAVRDRAVLNLLSRDNRVSRWFRSSGYDVYFQRSVGFAGTATNSSATSSFEPTGLARVRLALARSELLLFAVHMSVPGRLRERFTGEAERGEARLQALRTLPRAAALPGPKFVVAHSLAAHQPYVYDSSCAVVGKARHIAEPHAAYLAAVACTERLALAAVHSILAASRVPPVIVLQSDHGTSSLVPPDTVDSIAYITPAQARECTGAFGAYLVPGAAMPDTVTPANVFRYVVRALGGRVELDSDDSYYNAYDAAYEFVDVTRYLTAPPGSDASSGRPAALAGLGGPVASH